MRTTNDDEDAITTKPTPDGRYYFCVFHLSMKRFNKAVIPNTLLAEFVAHKEDVAPNLLYQQFVDRWFVPSGNYPKVDPHEAWDAYEDFQKNRWVFQGLIFTNERPDLEVGKIYEAFSFYNDVEMFGNRFYSIRTRKCLEKKRAFIRYASFLYECLNLQCTLLSSLGGSSSLTFVLPQGTKALGEYLKLDPKAPLPIQAQFDKEEVLNRIYFMEEGSEEVDLAYTACNANNGTATGLQRGTCSANNGTATGLQRGTGKCSKRAALKNGDGEGIILISDTEEQTKNRLKTDAEEDGLDNDTDGKSGTDEQTKKCSKTDAKEDGVDNDTDGDAKEDGVDNDTDGDFNVIGNFSVIGCWKMCDAVEDDTKEYVTLFGYFNDGQDTFFLKASLKKDDNQMSVVEETDPTEKARRKEKEKLYKFFNECSKQAALNKGDGEGVVAKSDTAEQTKKRLKTDAKEDGVDSDTLRDDNLIGCWKMGDAIENAVGRVTIVGYFNDGQDTIELKTSLKKDDPPIKRRKKEQEKLCKFFDEHMRRFFEE